MSTDFIERARERARAQAEAQAQSIDGVVRPAALEEQINMTCRNLLTGPEGEQLMLYLRTITTNVALPPWASDQELRYLEGQRRLVAILDARRTSKPKDAA